MARQTGEFYQIRNTQKPEDGFRELNSLLARLTSRLDKLEGLNGTPTFHAAPDMSGKRLTNVGNPVGAKDAQIKELALSRDSASSEYDAGGVKIVNAGQGVNTTDVVIVQQLKETTDSIDLRNESFVVIANSGTLNSERALAAEATVTTLTDAGPNSTVTVGVATNGITDAKLRQGAAVSVIGRSVNSSGNVADIAAAANGNVLRRAANVVGFGQIDIADGTNAITGKLAVANGGTNSSTALNNDRIMVSNTGAIVEAGAMTNGQLLIGSTAAAPVVAALTAGSGITVTNGAGSITVATALTLAVGTYSPTLTNVTNAAASTAYTCQYMRVGSVVTVSGKIDIDPTAAGLVQVGVSLPIASNFSAQEQCGGTAVAPGIAGEAAGILADATNDRAEINWTTVDITNQSFYFSFTYQII